MKKNNKIKRLEEYKKEKKNKYKKERTKKYKSKILRVFAVTGVMITFIGNIWVYSISSQLKYEIHYLKQDLKKEQIKLEQINSKISTNTSIEEIEKQAKEKLNMNYPSENQIRYVKVNE